jgi:hypothetical protein
MAKGNLQAFSYKHLSGAGSTQVFTGDGVLGGIFCASGSATPTCTIYDDTTATNILVNTFTMTPGQWYQLPFAFAKGLLVVLGGTTPDATVAYLA